MESQTTYSHSDDFTNYMFTTFQIVKKIINDRLSRLKN